MTYGVIVIDDSSLMRQLLSDMINQIDGFNVITTACDAYDAREKIKLYDPDLIMLDINMPKMDGVTFLQNLIRLHPMPAVVVSSDVSRKSEAFNDGALDFIHKKLDNESSEDFFERLKASLLKIRYSLDRYQLKKTYIAKKHLDPKTGLIETEKRSHPDELLPSKPSKFIGKRVIAIGSSTGGVEALIKIFSLLKPNRPPIIIAQHIPYGFSGSFAQRLGTVGPIASCEAKNGDLLEYGHAYVAPGNAHLQIERRGDNYYAKVVDGIKVSRHKPSVDILFRSTNNEAGAGALGIILTGMGDDGAIGIRELHDNGANTIAQNEASCIVYGMPKRAVENGGIKQIMSLEEIAEAINLY
ncbi:MAG: protein glutamate methylesterase CheB associated with MCPs of class response receiver [Pseudomonadota bacterium]|jgi:two-component system chemotaxis response regulator CheB